MNDPLLEELVSAYLDDEVTEEERSRVEKALDENAELRQLLAELQSLRSAVASFPRFRLDADFSFRVIDEAKAQQGGAASSESTPPEAPPADHVEVVVRETPATIPFDQRRWKAGYITVAVLAAALLFIVFRPPAVDDGTITRQEPTPESDVAQGTSEDGHEGSGPQDASSDGGPSETRVATSDAAQNGSPSGADEQRVASAPRQPPEPSQPGDASPVRPGESSPPRVPDNVVAVEAPLSGASLRMVDLRTAELQVVRATVAPEVIRERAFDQLLARHGIPFELDQAILPMPEEAERMANAAIERGFDIIHVEAGRAQQRSFLLELSQRSKEFPVTAVYFAPAEAHTTLFLMQALNPPANGDDPPGQNGNSLGGPRGLNSTGEAHAVSAWRPHLESWEKVNELFPLPKPSAAPKEFTDREWEAAVEAGVDPESGQLRRVYLIFILRVAP